MEGATMNYALNNDQLENDPRRAKTLARDIQWLIVRYPTDTMGFRAHVELDDDGLRVNNLDDYTEEQYDRMIRDFDICYAKLYPPMASTG
jgi:hypothetical protein